MKNKNLEEHLEKKEKTKVTPEGLPKIKRKRRTREELNKETLKDNVSIQSPGVDLLKPLIKVPFDSWATANQIEALRLSDAEALSMAVNIDKLLQYYLPQLPPVAYAWGALFTQVTSATLIRIKIIDGIKKKKAQENEDRETADNEHIRKDGVG